VVVVDHRGRRCRAASLVFPRFGGTACSASSVCFGARPYSLTGLTLECGVTQAPSQLYKGQGGQAGARGGLVFQQRVVQGPTRGGGAQGPWVLGSLWSQSRGSLPASCWWVPKHRRTACGE
jgi:hypothetical protein